MYDKFYQMTDFFYPKYHIGALLSLLYVDAVRHEVLIESCPLDILFATAKKDFRN